MGVIPAFDEIEDYHAGLDLGFETATVEQFAFERGKETFADRVIEAIADRAHRRPYLGLAAALAEGERSVLAALVGVMNNLARTALPERHVERLEHQLGAQIGLHRPAYDPPTEHIEHHGEVEKPRPGRDVGDIRNPQAIGRRGGEVALNQDRARAARCDRAPW
jgi:hypothetical protein